MAATDNNSFPVKPALIGGLLVIGAVIAVILDGLVVVPAGHVGVIYDLGSGVIEEQFEEGLNIKIPLWQQATLMDARTQEYTMSASRGEGAVINDDSIEARSKDGQIVKLDATILFHIDKAKAYQIKKQLGDERDYQRKIIRPRSRQVLRDVVAKYNAVDLVSEKRAEIVKEMNTGLTNSFTQHSIVLEDVVLRNVTFSEAFTAAIEDKQVEFQKIKTEEYRKDQAEQIKQRKIIEAEGESKAIELKSQALRNNPEIIQFEFIQKMAPAIKWGILPQSATPLVDVSKLQQ